MQIKRIVTKSFKPLPLFGSLVQAGFPSPADDFLEGRLDLNDLIDHPASTFSVRVSGDSMIEAGIFPGDILIVDRSRSANNGDVVLAILDRDFTIKRFEKINGQVWLKPENKKYNDILVDPNSDFEIWGVVTCVLHNPNKNAGRIL